MKKVLFNTGYGGFGVSDDALYLMYKYCGPLERESLRWVSIPTGYTQIAEGVYAHNYNNHLVVVEGTAYTILWFDQNKFENRSHPILIKVFEELGAEKASGPYGRLAIKEIDDSARYTITNFSGYESVQTACTMKYVDGFIIQ